MTDSNELRRALERALDHRTDRPRRVVRLERRRSLYRTSHALEEIDVALEDGETFALVLKDLSRAALHEDALRAMPAFMYDPLREVEVYRDLLAAASLGTAKCYAAAADGDRAWLLLERVDGAELYQLEIEAWEQAAGWLAHMHKRLAGRIRAQRLLRLDEQHYRLWFRRAEDMSEDLESIADVYEQGVERLLALPQTVVHGEFYASNVLVDGDRVCPIDWELAGVGPSLVDLAALTSGRWSEDDRTRIALAYRGALSDPPPLDDFFETLECCRLYLAVRWLGWSADWTPPAEHAQDWRAEALAAAERLA